MTTATHQSSSRRTWIIAGAAGLLVILAAAFLMSHLNKSSKSPVALGDRATQPSVTVDPVSDAAAAAEKASRQNSDVYYRLTANALTVDLPQARSELSETATDTQLSQEFQSLQLTKLKKQTIAGTTDDHYTVVGATPTSVRFDICESSHLVTTTAGESVPDDPAYTTFESTVQLTDGTWKIASLAPKGGGMGQPCTPVS